MNFLKLLLVSALFAGLSLNLKAQSANGAATNFWGNYEIHGLHKDPSKPQTGRSYLTTEVQEIPGGFKFIVDLWNGKINEPVSLFLQAAINDGNGNMEPIPFMTLSDKVIDNNTDYHSRREFLLTYADVNKALKSILPPSAQHIEVGPGSPLFVLGEWTDYGHNWGGIGRGGIFYTPEVSGSSVVSSSNKVLSRAIDLDIGYEIKQAMTLLYNIIDPQGNSVGLKQGGQIKSRLESEGKFQIPLDKAIEVRKKLIDLANDKIESDKILGPDWSIMVEDRYMLKDSQGKFLLDSQGLQIPDPMVDTYQDSNDYKGAKNDISIRYRETKGNGEGAWNLKPGFSPPSKEGVVNRVEFAVETTDDKPETVKKFADSFDPLNPFKIVRTLIPGTKPSDLLEPSIKSTDIRPKFKLKHKNGLIIEVSVDNVEAESLRNPNKKVRFAQVEMDVDHPAAKSTNVATPTGAFNGLSSDISSYQRFLNSITATAFLDGRPVIHTSADLDESSPLRQKIKSDLDLAEEVTKNLRNHIIGENWLPGPQKYSLAAVLLGEVSEADASPSVKNLFAQMKKLNKKESDFFEGGKFGFQCRRLFSN